MTTPKKRKPWVPVTAQSILHSKDTWEEIERKLREYEYVEGLVARPKTYKPGPHPVNNAHRKFTDEQITDMRKAHAEGQSIRSLAKQYEVSWEAMSSIIKHRSYK